MHRGGLSQFVYFEKIVYNICKDFLIPRGLSYFHFRRNYKDGSQFILANNMALLNEFYQGNFKDVAYPPPICIRQSLAYFWDDCCSEELIILTREKLKLYHGITIINRHKEYYDCAAFALPATHPSPSTHYLNLFHDLKVYSELFPKFAQPLIKQIESERIKLDTHRQDTNRISLFLPYKSKRILIEPGLGNYVTTFELLCLQLLHEGNTYKEIGDKLSMSARTVETHLARLKTRTNLSVNKLLTKSFKLDILNSHC